MTPWPTGAPGCMPRQSWTSASHRVCPALELATVGKFLDPAVAGSAFDQRWASPALDLGAGVSSVAFSPDGLTLSSGSLDRTVGLWDIRLLSLLLQRNDASPVWLALMDAARFLWQLDVGGLNVQAPAPRPNAVSVRGAILPLRSQVPPVAGPARAWRDQIRPGIPLGGAAGQGAVMKAASASAEAAWPMCCAEIVGPRTVVHHVYLAF